jgi:hypothetical protein
MKWMKWMKWTYQVNHARKQRRGHTSATRPAQLSSRIHMEPRAICAYIRHRPPSPIKLTSIRANVLAVGRLVVGNGVIGNIEVVVHDGILVFGAGEDVGETGAGGVVAAVYGHFGVRGVAGGVGADGCRCERC